MMYSDTIFPKDTTVTLNVQRDLYMKIKNGIAAIQMRGRTTAIIDLRTLSIQQRRRMLMARRCGWKGQILGEKCNCPLERAVYEAMRSER